MGADGDKKHPRYQDYVIRDGVLVGEFEEMYRDHDDPWHQLAKGSALTEKAVGLDLLRRLSALFGVRRVLELGCGLGQYADRIAAEGFDVTGLDVSATAIDKARQRYPRPRFEVAGIDAHDLTRHINPDVIVMAEVTWYVLDQIDAWLDFLRTQLPDAFLFHTLIIYPDGKQQYGRDYFTDLDGVLDYFGMRYLEWGTVHGRSENVGTYFLGTWNEDLNRRWRQ